ncbi:MAG: glycerophosphodiester phosphodiesterase family protein, partial [Pseudomonadota bacterium]
MTCRLPEAFLKAPLAHRALHDVRDGRPENSRAAIRAALARGYGIEIDVQASADSQAVVFHDYQLQRLARAEGAVNAYSSQTLSQILLRGADEGIPDLAEILQLVAGQVPLLVEIKDQDGQMGPDMGPLPQRVAEALRDYSGPVAVMSFNPHAIAEMAVLAPHVPRGLVTSGYKRAVCGLPEATCAHLRAIPDFARAACSFISHEWADLARPRVAELKAEGAHVLCWTVKSPQEEAQARKYADNIT